MTAQETRTLAIGASVFCTVNGCRGWHRVLAIRPRDGYIKIDGFTAWCPPHNFKKAEKCAKCGSTSLGAFVCNDCGTSTLSKAVR